MSNYARAGEVEKLEWSLTRMKGAEIQPNLRSYEILMSGYGVGAFFKMNECLSLILHYGHNRATNTFHSHALPHSSGVFGEEVEEVGKSEHEEMLECAGMVLLQSYRATGRVSEFFDILEKLNVRIVEWPLILLETRQGLFANIRRCVSCNTSCA